MLLLRLASLNCCLDQKGRSTAKNHNGRSGSGAAAAGCTVKMEDIHRGPQYLCYFTSMIVVYLPQAEGI
jgi:hypothetical protein